MNDHNVNFINSDIKVDPVVQNILHKNKAVFEGVEKLKNLQLKLHIDDSVTPIQQPVNRLPYHTRAKVADELERLIKKDCIEKVEGLITWISPIAVVPKHNGGIRVCLDTRRANEALIRERYMIPNLEGILPDLHDPKCFSKINLRGSYHQIELEEESKRLQDLLPVKEFSNRNDYHMEQVQPSKDFNA